MAKVDSDLLYLSAGCNTSPHCLSWGHNNVVLYGSDANIIVSAPGTSNRLDAIPGFKACQSLRHHSDMVSCLNWIKDLQNPTASETEFISLSTDKTCAVWTFKSTPNSGTEETWKFAVMQQLELNVPLQVGRSVYLGGDQYDEMDLPRKALLAISGIDGSVTIWLRKDKLGFEVKSNVSFGRGQILDLDWTKINGDSGNILACGGDDGKVHVFGLSSDAVHCTKLAVLEGHEDWIRTIQFSLPDSDGLIHMLSAGQDCTIRLWTIYEGDSYQADSDNLWNLVNSRKFRLTGQTSDCHIVYNTLLLGHEGWIYGAHWAPRIIKDGKTIQPLQILSASMDKTVIIWEPLDEFGGIWSDTSRVGEVGGNNLGFYGCQFGPDGNSILSHSFSGSLHLWIRDQENLTWKPSVVPGGHFSAVHDLTWDYRGLYVISTSQDQTTRLHAPWLQSSDREEWHEIARPQVHGYDLQCLASTGAFSFASGAEEKIVRHFHAPKNFLSNFSALSKVDVSHDMNSVPEGASVPALGLSNKAVFQSSEDGQGDRYPSDRYPTSHFATLKLSQPPSEEDLIQNTLWPETHKLYGHGYEISSLASNHSGSVLASASRAARPEDAEIYLWRMLNSADPSKFSITLENRLPAHTLTVTQMAFSHHDRFLLSVSRDRTWVVSQRTIEDRYEVAVRSEKSNGHTRIVWTCAWTPDDKYFATGSRDKTACVHHVAEANGKLAIDLLYRLNFDDSVTALDLSYHFGIHNRFILVVGVEDGHLELYSFDRAGTEEPTQLLTLPDRHHKTVNRIRFQPSLGDGHEECSLLMATCGTDRAVKIFKLSVQK